MEPAPGQGGRAENPNWRGQFSGGSRSQRRRAGVELSTEEATGVVEPSSDRAPIVAGALEARGLVKAARDRQLQQKYDQLEAETEADPYKWPCSQCIQLEEQPDGSTKKKDVYMKGTRMQCRKCNRPRPEPDSKKSWRWMCPECSRDDYTMGGEYTHCTDCNRRFNDATDPHWQMQFALAAAGEQGGGGGDAPDRKRKKKRGGKRHKKAPLPSEPGLEPAVGAESSEDSAGYMRPVAKRRNKFASGGRRAPAPLWWLASPLCQPR